MQRCGLADLRDEPAGSLSIGKIRLLELARAIVDDPKVLLLDEPTSGLEEHEAHRFGQVVREFRDTTGAAVLLVEHDVPFVMGLSDRVTVLNLGEVIAEGTPEEVSRQPGGPRRLPGIRGTMQEFIDYTLVGAAAGAIYALIASGLALSYTATGIFNFAYGAIAYVSAMMFYQLNTGLGWNRLVVLILTVGVFCPLLGLLLNKAVFRPLARATDEAKIMCTVGLLVALPALANYIVLGGISTFDWNLKDPSQANLPPGIWRSPAERPPDR